MGADLPLRTQRLQGKDPSSETSRSSKQNISLGWQSFLCQCVESTREAGPTRDPLARNWDRKSQAAMAQSPLALWPCLSFTPNPKSSQPQSRELVSPGVLGLHPLRTIPSVLGLGYSQYGPCSTGHKDCTFSSLSPADDL